MITLYRFIAIVCCAALTTGAPAQEQPADLNIPPQSLAVALDALAEQTGLLNRCQRARPREPGDRRTL